ncbi:hypothetical protein [Georgenia sp. MJ170]|uniref:hypothetical protein n=1 Tax=Georgenia sunbinii TaxID=3117728 RepID=UPI002F26D2D7
MKRGIGSVAFLLAIVALTGCAAESIPEVTPAPESEATTPVAATDDTAAADDVEAEAEAEAEETPEPTVGDREAPLAIGEARKLSNQSAWTVSLESSNLDAAEEILASDEWADRPAEGEVFVVGTFTVSVDAEPLDAQGIDLANEGADPWASIFVEFVAADGRGYDGSSGTMCYTQNMLYEQGTLYEDGASVTGDTCIAVPDEQLDGGLWRISNMVNDNVWISAS